MQIDPKYVMTSYDATKQMGRHVVMLGCSLSNMTMLVVLIPPMQFRFGLSYKVDWYPEP